MIILAYNSSDHMIILGAGGSQIVGVLVADSVDFFSIKNSMHELLKLNSSWTSPSFTVSPMFVHSITPVRNR